jgi:hypothetical protein
VQRHLRISRDAVLETILTWVKSGEIAILERRRRLMALKIGAWFKAL